MPKLLFARLLMMLALVVAFAGCSGGEQNQDGGAPAKAPAAETKAPEKLRLGFFPNVTHAPALVGIGRGDFQKALGEQTKLETIPFNAGPSVIEALFSGDLDLAFIGPSPTINGYLRSGGDEVRVIAGAVENGTVVVGSKKRNITTVEQLRGARIATPQLGNTQDISAKHYVISVLKTPLGAGEGKTEVISLANPDIEILFEKDQLDAAWVPEPWASRMIDKGLVVKIIEEKDLWPAKRFALTNIIARKKFLEENPALVEKFLRAHVAITKELAADSKPFVSTVNDEIRKATGKSLPVKVIEESFAHCGFRVEVDRSVFESFLAKGRELAIYRAGGPALEGLFDTKILDKILAEEKAPAP